MTEGPFKDLRPDYKSNDTHPHCLERDFYPAIPQANLQEMLGFGYNPTVIAGINANNDFLSFHSTLLEQLELKFSSGIIFSASLQPRFAHIPQVLSWWSLFSRNRRYAGKRNEKYTYVNLNESDAKPTCYGFHLK